MDSGKKQAIKVNSINMKKIFFLIILLYNLSAYGQQDQLFTQYMFNKLVVNPAYAGTQENLKIDILDRYQWLGIDGSPRTITIGAHTPLRNNKIGLGFYIYRDALGPSINQGFMATYAYHIRTMNGHFSFGIQFGFKHFSFDWASIRAKDPDILFMPQELQKIYPDALVYIIKHPVFLPACQPNNCYKMNMVLESIMVQQHFRGCCGIFTEWQDLPYPSTRKLFSDLPPYSNMLEMPLSKWT